MKVKDFLKKVNGASAKLPVYLCPEVGEEMRMANGWDFSGEYHYDEKEKTIRSISIMTDKVVVYYKAD